MLTSVNSILDSACVPKMVYSFGCRFAPKSTASIHSMFRGVPLNVLGALSVSVDQGTGGSIRAGDMVAVVMNGIVSIEGMGWSRGGNENVSRQQCNN